MNFVIAQRPHEQTTITMEKKEEKAHTHTHTHTHTTYKKKIEMFNFYSHLKQTRKKMTKCLSLGKLA